MREWDPSGVPSTVVAALVNNKVYPDPYFAMNLRSIPGTTYNIGQNFANLPMPADSTFAVSWWYRSEFKLPAAVKGKKLWLNFDAINGQQTLAMQNRAMREYAARRGWTVDMQVREVKERN
jgi:exo-1,4-beta-D-glucosaminidase